MSDAFVMYNEFAHGGIEMSYGMQEDGSYEEWISNDSARHIFEELYHLAWDIRKLIESPMARNQRRLERLTLRDPHFKRLFSMLQEDLDIHTWGQLKTRVQQLGKRVATELKDCPYFQKTVSILMQMKTLCETTREVTDMGDEKTWRSWWETNDFQNPFDHMEMGEMDHDMLL